VWVGVLAKVGTCDPVQSLKCQASCKHDVDDLQAGRVARLVAKQLFQVLPIKPERNKSPVYDISKTGFASPNI
jgi:hypothetical protein